MVGQPGSTAPRRGDISPDRQFTWDGSAWRPILRWRWEPTRWTYRLQVLAGGYFIFQGIVGAAVLLTTKDQFRSALLAQMTRQIAASNSTSPPDPAQLAQIADLAANAAVGAGLVAGVLGLVLGILTILRRWTWLFYVDLVLFGLGGLGIPSDVSNLRSGYPAALMVPSLIFSTIAVALFASLLVARVKRGVWGARRVPDLAQPA